MLNYLISFIMFGIYLLVESKLKSNKVNLLFFYVLCMIIGVIGIITINMFSYDFLEYFFILIFGFSGLEIYKNKKSMKR